MDLLSLSPVSRAENANDIAPIREANCNHPIMDLTYAIEAILGAAMRNILHDNTMGIKKRQLRQPKWDAVLFLIFLVLVVIPFKARPFHGINVALAAR